jgi:hypothetical protein
VQRTTSVLPVAAHLWGANVTLLSSMTRSETGPSLTVEGPTTHEIFETYIEKVSVPALREGQVMVNKPSSHNGFRVREFSRSEALLYLPLYSPHLINPTEEAFSNFLRSRGYCVGGRSAAGRLGRLWCRRWAPLSLRSVAARPEASSRTAATAYWSNNNDERSRNTLEIYQRLLVGLLRAASTTFFYSSVYLCGGD